MAKKEGSEFEPSVVVEAVMLVLVLVLSMQCLADISTLTTMQAGTCVL